MTTPRSLIALSAISVCIFTLAQTAIADLHTAVTDPSRLEAQSARDPGRKPEEVLAFTFGRSAEGLVIADLVPGGGYYTAILSRAVGNKGKVYAINPTRIFEKFPAAKENFPNYLKDDPRTNVVYSVQKMDEIDIPEPVDAVLMVLYYHDLVWTGVDRARMNQRIYDSLKPGGLYLVIDHHALAGAEDSVTQELHRMDAALALEEIPQAGFTLVGESNLLSNPEDPRTTSVFAPEARGKTDRFIYLYRKPH